MAEATGLPALPSELEFHHVGWATADLERDLEHFRMLGFRREGDDFEDPLQGITGCFVVLQSFRVELLTPLPGSSTLEPWLRAGIRFYHSAYLTLDLDASIEWARANRAKLVVRPTPSVAFDGRRIAFVMFRNGALVEFVESEG